MKLAATIALGLAISTVSNVNAQNATPSATTHTHPMPVVASPEVHTYSAPTVTTRSRRYSAQQNQSFFGQLMDLERRKNAWLRRTFLGGR